MIHVIFLPIKQPALNSTLFSPLSWKIYEPAPKHIKKDNTHTHTNSKTTHHFAFGRGGSNNPG